MEWYHKAHLALTFVLFAAVTVFLVLLLTGAIGVRSRRAAPLASRTGAQPTGVRIRLRLLRGLKTNWEYRIFEGRNVIGLARTANRWILICNPWSPRIAFGRLVSTRPSPATAARWSLRTCIPRTALS